MNGFLLVAAGGGIGAAARHGLSVTLGKSSGVLAILTANVLGSFLMGLVMGWLASRADGADNATWLFLCVGVFGGFTTFSSFSLQTVQLIEQGYVTKAASYVGGSVIGAVGFLFLGLVVGRKVFGA